MIYSHQPTCQIFTLRLRLRNVPDNCREVRPIETWCRRWHLVWPFLEAASSFCFLDLMSIVSPRSCGWQWEHRIADASLNCILKNHLTTFASYTLYRYPARIQLFAYFTYSFQREKRITHSDRIHLGQNDGYGYQFDFCTVDRGVNVAWKGSGTLSGDVMNGLLEGTLRCVPDESGCEFDLRFYGISFLVCRFFYAEAGQYTCYSKPCNIQRKVASGAYPPTKSKSFYGIRNLGIQLTGFCQEAARVEGIRVGITTLFMKYSPNNTEL